MKIKLRILLRRFREHVRDQLHTEVYFRSGSKQGLYIFYYPIVRQHTCIGFVAYLK